MQKISIFILLSFLIIPSVSQAQQRYTHSSKSSGTYQMNAYLLGENYFVNINNYVFGPYNKIINIALHNENWAFSFEEKNSLSKFEDQLSKTRDYVKSHKNKYIKVGEKVFGPYKTAPDIELSDDRLLFDIDATGEYGMALLDGKEKIKFRGYLNKMVVNGKSWAIVSTYNKNSYIIYNGKEYGPYEKVNSLTIHDDLKVGEEGFTVKINDKIISEKSDYSYYANTLSFDFESLYSKFEKQDFTGYTTIEEKLIAENNSIFSFNYLLFFTEKINLFSILLFLIISIFTFFIIKKKSLNIYLLWAFTGLYILFPLVTKFSYYRNLSYYFDSFYLPSIVLFISALLITRKYKDTQKIFNNYTIFFILYGFFLVTLKGVYDFLIPVTQHGGILSDIYTIALGLIGLAKSCGSWAPCFVLTQMGITIANIISFFILLFFLYFISKLISKKINSV